jgi:phage protein U
VQFCIQRLDPAEERLGQLHRAEFTGRYPDRQTLDGLIFKRIFGQS